MMFAFKCISANAWIRIAHVDGEASWCNGVKVAFGSLDATLGPKHVYAEYDAAESAVVFPGDEDAQDRHIAWRVCREGSRPPGGVIRMVDGTTIAATDVEVYQLDPTVYSMEDYYAPT